MAKISTTFSFAWKVLLHYTTVEFRFTVVGGQKYDSDKFTKAMQNKINLHTLNTYNIYTYINLYWRLLSFLHLFTDLDIHPVGVLLWAIPCWVLRQEHIFIELSKAKATRPFNSPRLRPGVLWHKWVHSSKTISEKGTECVIGVVKSIFVLLATYRRFRAVKIVIPITNPIFLIEWCFIGT